MSRTMAHAIEISPATEKDIEQLVDIGIQAKQSDRLQSLMLAQATQPAELDRQWTRVSLTSSLEDTRSRLFKAALQDNKQILGYGFLYSYPADWMDDKIPETSGVDGLNDSLLRKYWDMVGDLQKKAVGGRAHYVCSFPRILPQYQHQDLEEAMMRLAFLHYGLEKEILWITTDSPAASKALQRLSWHRVESATLDLSPWEPDQEKPSRLEVFSLVRQPGELRA